MNSAHLLLIVAACAFTSPAYGDGPRDRRGGAEAPAQVLTNANMQARRRPTPDAFTQARHIYRFAEGALYELYANPNFISTILLEPGEIVIDIAAGDTARWMVTETQGETQRDGRTIVLIKPQASNLRTNIVIVTDRRTYLIEAIAQSGDAYAAQVAWSYAETETAQRDPTPLDNFDFNYRVRTVRGRRPVWTPARVFDDGRRTWIEFTPQVAAADLPPLFVITSEGAELVNYRVEGHRYMVDRVFDAAELRLGARNPVVVRIDRIGARPQRRASVNRGRRS